MKLSQYRPAAKMGEALPKSPHDLRRRKSLGYQRQSTNEFGRTARVLAKEWRWSALLAASIAVAVTCATLAMRPVYESEGRLQIDPPGAEIFSLDTAHAGLIDSEYIATETQKLQTDELALGVIRALRLDMVKEITGNVSPSTTGQQRADRLTPAESAAVANFRSRLSIRRDPSTRLVGITFAAHDPSLSANVVNTLMNQLVDRNRAARNQAIAESSAWLSSQLEDIRSKMEVAARALADFGTKTGIADVDPSSNTYAEKMGDLNKQLVQAEADRIQFQSFLTSVNNPDALPQVRGNPVIQALTQRLADANAQLAQSRVIYGPNHVEVRKLQNQVDELKEHAEAQRAAIVAELWTSYRAAKIREGLLTGEVKKATTDLATLGQYNALKKEAQADRDLYDSLYAKIKEAGISAASKSGNIHVVNQARVLDHPTRPRRALNIMAGIVMGLIAGVALAFVKDRIQDRIHTIEDIREWPELPPVTILPSFRKGESGNNIDATLKGLTMQPNGNGLSALPDCFLLQRPNAPESEAIHALRTMVFVSQGEDAPKVVLITSPLPGEGKTTIASNLAIALAKHGRTCLVDADLRMPTVGSSFRMFPKRGLESYLQGSATLDQVALPSRDVKNLTIIASADPTDHANYLLTGGYMKSLITRLRERFDFVVIDSPPVLVYADGLAVSTMADGVILVSRAGQTPRGAITRSMELLATIKAAPVLTVVINAVDEHPKYSGYSY